MTIGEFLSSAVEWLRQLWPIVVLAPWERGLRVTRGRPGKEDLAPGIRWFVPLIGEIHREEVNIAGFVTDPQTIDGTTFQIAVRYRIRDVRAYYLKIHDAEETLDTTVQIAAAQEWARDEPEGGPELASWDSRLEEATRRRMFGWGVEILDVVPVTSTESPALRILGTPAGG